MVGHAPEVNPCGLHHDNKPAKTKVARKAGSNNRSKSETRRKTKEDDEEAKPEEA